MNKLLLYVTDQNQCLLRFTPNTSIFFLKGNPSAWLNSETIEWAYLYFELNVLKK